MAIPIGLPNSEDAEDSYRSLDLLLEQLLITLRQILIHRRRVAAANASLQNVRHRHATSEETAVEETTEEIDRPEEAMRIPREESTISGLPLPDVVLDSSPDCGTPQEQKESERTRAVNVSETMTTTTTTTTQTHSWVQVGADLKRKADQLLATNRFDQKEEKKTKIKEEKEASLLSLFRPPLGGSVWTTVVLLVGLGLLTRTR